MKKHLILSILFMQFLLLQAFSQDDQESFLTRTFPANSVKQVKAQTSGGHISITGGEGEAKVEMIVKPSNRILKSWSKEDIQKKLDEDYNVTIEVKENTLVAIAEPKKKINWNSTLSISFKIHAPRNAGTNLRTSGGHIDISNLSGNQDFATSGGHLNISKLTGKVVGKTSGGHISIDDSHNDINLHTSGGSITAERCNGKLSLRTSGGGITIKQINGDVDASTSGGSIRVDDVKGELLAHTSGGNVTIKSHAGSLEATTSGGNINASLTELGKFVKLRTSGGGVELDMPGNKGLDLNLSANRVNLGALKNFDGTLEKDRVDGKLNGGGIPVTIRGGSRLSLTLK